MNWVAVIHDEPYDDGPHTPEGGPVIALHGPFGSEAAVRLWAKQNSIWGCEPMEMHQP